MKRMKSTLAALATLMVLLGSASGVMAQGKAMGPPETPHGYPAWISDSNNLKLDLCINSTMCLPDPVEAGNPFSELTGFGGEAFWLLAGAQAALPGPVDGRDAVGELTLALEAAYGGDEAIMDGNQVAFGRVRVRLDILVPGDYRVTHPYGQMIFENVGAGRRAVNVTKDIGGVNPGNPAAAFNGTLASDIMNPGGDILNPNATTFITWNNYATNPALLVDGKRYIGNPGTDSTIVGSPTGNNFFRIERRTGPDTWSLAGETALFSLQGRVFDNRAITEKTQYDNTPPQKLASTGPVNRVSPFVPWSATPVTGQLVPGYPIGYPLWYEDASGLKVTITFPPYGISDPLLGGEPLNTAGETFYWSAGATIEGYAGTGNDASVEYGLEGTFGGTEDIVDGNQIAFGRLRIRIDTSTAGEYTVIHPYGNNTFNVAEADLAGGINFTQDIGGVNPFDPDSAFDGTLYSIIGPNLLTWLNYKTREDLNLTDPSNPTGPKLRFVGRADLDPEPVTGGTNGNIFRVIGPSGSGIDVQTNLFTVTGQIFDVQNLGFLPSIYLLLD